MSAMHKHDAAPLLVQQIMDAIVGCEASDDELREMIAAALADARREGAKAMRDAAQAAPSGIDERGIPTVTVWQIRALPLPTAPSR